MCPSRCRAGSNGRATSPTSSRVCESEQAIDTVQQRNRELLKAISRERAELYAELGESFSGRRQIIRNRTTAPPAKPKRGKPAKVAIKTVEEQHG